MIQEKLASMARSLPRALVNDFVEWLRDIEGYELPAGEDGQALVDKYLRWKLRSDSLLDIVSRAFHSAPKVDPDEERL